MLELYIQDLLEIYAACFSVMLLEISFFKEFEIGITLPVVTHTKIVVWRYGDTLVTTIQNGSSIEYKSGNAEEKWWTMSVIPVIEHDYHSKQFNYKNVNGDQQCQ